MLKQTLSGRQVPVIEDQGKVVHDSFAIAQYLERTYPDQPSLFGGPGGKPYTWLYGPLLACCLLVLAVSPQLLGAERVCAKLIQGA